MEATTVRLYTFNYDEAKTYIWAAIFVVCNLVLPQVFHLIPQGGVIFSPLSLVILAGAYKFGWKTGLLAALLSPLVNHTLTSMPAWDVLAQRFKTVNLLLLIVVVLTSKAIEGLGELAITGGVTTTIADFAIGWPGLLMQIFGTWLILKYIHK